MENRAHALAAGLFTLVLGAALAAVALWFSKEELKLIPYAMLTSNSVTGLKVEAPVRYRGVDVGKVDEIAIDSANGGRVRVRIGVREGTPITKSTYAQLGYQGITGLAYVLLGDDGSSKEALTSAPENVALIRMKPSLMDAGEGLFGSFAEIADKVNRLLDNENQGRVRRTLAGMEEVTERVNVAARKLEPSLEAMPGLIVEAKSLAADARASVHKADQLISSVNGLALKLDGQADTLKLGERLDALKLGERIDALRLGERIDALRLDERMDGLTRAAASVEEVGVIARQLREETVPRMNGLIDDLSKETRTVGRVVNTLGENPQSLVFGTPPGRPGPGEPGFAGGR